MRPPRTEARMTAEIIGRDEELGAIEGVPRARQLTARVHSCSRARRGSARPSSGRQESKRPGAFRPGSRLPWRRGRGVALVRRAVRAAGAACSKRWRRRLRRRDGARSRWRSCSSSRATSARIRTRSDWPCSTCCALVAERGPVLVALDDAQWLDPASAGVLQIALRRLRDEPIAPPRHPADGPGARRARSSSSARSRKGGSSGSRSARSAWAPFTASSRSDWVST